MISPKFLEYLIKFYLLEICFKTLISKLFLSYFGYDNLISDINIFVVALNVGLSIYFLFCTKNILKSELLVILSIFAPFVATSFIYGFKINILTHVLALFRFFPILLSWRFINDSFLRKISWFIFYLACFEILIGFIQFFGGELVFSFFSPPPRPEIGFSVIKDLENWNRDIFGTFEVQLAYSYFILFTYVLCNKLLKRKLSTYIYGFSSLFVLVASNSLIVILLFLLYNISMYSKKIKVNLGLFYLLTFIVSVFLLYFNHESIEDYFSVAYESNRLGIILNLSMDFFRNSSFQDVMFGFTNDDDLLLNKIFSANNVPTIFIDDNRATAILDVYFVAHLYYFGLFGIFCFVFMLINLTRSVIYSNFEDTANFKFIISMFSVLLFVNQLFNIEIGNFFIMLLISLSWYLSRSRLSISS